MEMLIDYNKLESEVSNWVDEFFHRDNFEDTDEIITELFSAYYNHKYLRYCVDELTHKLNLSADVFTDNKIYSKVVEYFCDNIRFKLEKVYFEKV